MTLSDPPIQLVVFDLMGTLVADDGVVAKAYRNALESVGLADTQLEDAELSVAANRGRPTLIVLTTVLGNAVQAEEATWAFDDFMLARANSLAPTSSAAALLDRLSQRKIAVGLTTSFSKEVREAVIAHQGWANLFAIQLAARGERRGHPAPDLLLEAILALRVDSVAQVAIIGDSAADLEAGNRAGAGLVIGLERPTSDAAGSLRDAPHTHLISSLSEVEPILDAPRTSGHRRQSDL